jgi:hypothetical protein
LRTGLVFAVISCICGLATQGYAQQVDLAFGAGSLFSSGNRVSNGILSPAEGGGAYVGFNGDVLFKSLWNGNVGVQAEVNWKASQGMYAGQVPDRPVFYDFNAIYARRFTERIGVEALGGIGASSVRFYQTNFNAYNNCGYYYYGCSNYTSSTHFMGDVGGGIRFYPYKSFFVRPEVRLYLINNNAEFSSGHPLRYGASVGYTFGGNK